MSQHKSGPYDPETAASTRRSDHRALSTLLDGQHNRCRGLSGTCRASNADGIGASQPATHAATSTTRIAPATASHLGHTACNQQEHKVVAQYFPTIGCGHPRRAQEDRWQEQPSGINRTSPTTRELREGCNIDRGSSVRGRQHLGPTQPLPQVVHKSHTNRSGQAHSTAHETGHLVGLPDRNSDSFYLAWASGTTVMG